ncbi:MAG: polysaccharide biosynthesis protein [Phycisphaerae bacterium]
MPGQLPEPTGSRPAPNQKLWVQYRTQISVALHGLLFVISLFSAFALAYNFTQWNKWLGPLFLKVVLVVVPTKLLVFWWLRQYRGSWRYVGLRDLFSIAWASYTGTFLFILCYFAVEMALRRLTGQSFFDPHGHFRQSVFLLDLAATIGFVCAARVSVRFYHEAVRLGPTGRTTRTLIIGAGDSGEALLREILRMPASGYEVVGFLDDRTHVHGPRIHGVDILGRTDDVKAVAEREEVEELLIALPSATPRELRRVVELCKGTNLRFRTIPPAIDLIEGRVQVSQIRDVHIEDLLSRDPVTLDLDAIGAVLKNERVVVTGAGGSIGSEMCRQIARFGPERLILIEQAENALFEIDRELRRGHGDLDIVPHVADITDAARIKQLLHKERPSAVFHAAAHKHVPMMEINPGEAVKNNVQGTRIVADAAVAAGVEKMVMISTDKAVNPTSVMGCSKRVAELYVQHLSARSKTQFVTVRFGNVLGSSGSVIPIFKQQIAEGGPVTVTHPEMTRFFMTIPEASQLVLQAGTMGRGGEIYVLDMGEPVRIVDLAQDMITLSGLRPGEDIEIQFSGIRPGEKLFEELSIVGEDVSRTKHPKIGIWNNRPEDWDRLRVGIEKLLGLADADDADAIRAQLGDMVAEYTPNPRTGPRSAGEADPSSPHTSASQSPATDLSGPATDPAFGV